MDYIYADMDEIVFESRDKEYGAYDNRKRYRRHLAIALSIAAIIFLLLILFYWLPVIFNQVPSDADEKFEIVEVSLDELPPPPPMEEEEVPPPPPVNTPPPVRTIEFRVPDPTPDDQLEEDNTIEEMENIEESNPDLETNLEGSDVGNYDWDNIDEGNNQGAFVEPPKEKEIGPDEFVMLEKEPAPVNMDDIKKLIGYPPMAKEAEIEGKVVLRVQVDKTGSYLKHIVIKDPHPILTAEVVKHIRSLKFTPGIQSGKPIKVWVTIPFDFKLLR